MDVLKKDVLFLCQFFYPEYVSSATLPYDTAKALVDAGFTVDVLCGYPKEYANSKVPKKENVDGINIQRVRYIQLGRKGFISRLVNYFSFTFSMIMKLYKMRNYKIIFVYTNPPILPFVASLAKMFFKVKLVFICYDMYPEIAIETKVLSHSSFIAKTMRIINRFTYKRFDFIIALSNDMKDKILLTREGFEESQIKIIPNWYTPDVTVKDEGRDTSVLDEIVNQNKFVVSYFGNMGIAQDMETIKQAIELSKNNESIIYLLVGHGNKQKELKEYFDRESYNNVFILDFLKGTDYDKALKLSRCLIVSLKQGLVGLAVPSKTYSYYSAGKPIIAIMDGHADIVNEVVGGNAGYYVQNGDYNKLYQSIIDLMSNPTLEKKMETNSRMLYDQKYCTSVATKKYIELVQGLIGGNENV